MKIPIKSNGALFVNHTIFYQNDERFFRSPVCSCTCTGNVFFDTGNVPGMSCMFFEKCWQNQINLWKKHQCKQTKTIFLQNFSILSWRRCYYILQKSNESSNSLETRHNKNRENKWSAYTLFTSVFLNVLVQFDPRCNLLSDWNFSPFDQLAKQFKIFKAFSFASLLQCLAILQRSFERTHANSIKIKTSWSWINYFVSLVDVSGEPMFVEYIRWIELNSKWRQILARRSFLASAIRCCLKRYWAYRY